MRAPCSAARRSSSPSRRRPTPRPARVLGDPHALQLGRLAGRKLEPAAADRLGAQRGDHEEPARRPQRVERRAPSRATKAPATARAGRARRRRPGAALRLGPRRRRPSRSGRARRSNSRSTSPSAATSRSRCDSVSGSKIDAASSSLRRSSTLRSARPLGVRRAVRTRRSPSLGHDLRQPGRLERAQQPAQVAGVDAEPGAEHADVAALLADLPEHARLAERPVAGEEAVVERADALGDEAVEAAELLHHLVVHRRRVHSLILVRQFGQDEEAATETRPSRGSGPPTRRCGSRRGRGTPASPAASEAFVASCSRIIERAVPSESPRSTPSCTPLWKP